MPNILPRKTIRVAVTGLVIFVLISTAYTWVVMNWSYSTGERAGYVQKLSKKGWVCKTWEGEMALISMPGTVAEKFPFTIRDDKVAAEINRSIGQRVALTYEQHLGIPTSCIGETQYFVIAVKVVDEPSNTAPVISTPPAVPTPAPAPTPAK
jgi:hypothetical protein